MKIPHVLCPSSGLVNLTCSFICCVIFIAHVANHGRMRFFCHFCMCILQAVVVFHCSGRRPSSIFTIACLINHCQNPCMRQTVHRITQECPCYPDKQSQGAETSSSHCREGHTSIAHCTIPEGMPPKCSSFPATPYHLRLPMKNNLSRRQLGTTIVPFHPIHLTIQSSKKKQWLELSRSSPHKMYFMGMQQRRS